MAVYNEKIKAGAPAGRVLVARATYDFAVQAGAVGTIGLMGGTKIPSGSTILAGWLEIATILTSSGSATAAIQVNAANDIITAAAYSGAPWSSTGLKSVIPAYTGATMVRTTAARDISLVIGTAALTAGKFYVVLSYLPPLA